jgi:hypothetical protein
MKIKAQWWVVLTVGFGLFSACGGSSDQPSTGGMLPTAATGGSKAGTSGGGGGAAGATGVACGAMTCSNPVLALPAMYQTLLGTPAAPCCATGNVCGFMTGGACVPPAPKMSCPTPMPLAGIMIPLTACCNTTTNNCGIDGSAVGMGCTNSIGPATTHCDGTPIATGAAGRGAAGSSTAGSSGSGTAGSNSAGSSAAGAGGARAGAGGGVSAGAGGRSGSGGSGGRGGAGGR